MQDYVKSDFCPGGHETFELDRGRLRYIFGSEGVTGVALNTVTPINDPPLLASPVRLPAWRTPTATRWRRSSPTATSARATPSCR
ncbi:MAG: hypothetical protein U0802_15970 [Candidatus Binatia bacterium]